VLGGEALPSRQQRQRACHRTVEHLRQPGLLRAVAELIDRYRLGDVVVGAQPEPVAVVAGVDVVLGPAHER